MSIIGVDNLATLPELDENILLRELKFRYQQNMIYVSSDPDLQFVTKFYFW